MKRIDKITGIKNTMGIAEQLAEIRGQEKDRQFVANLLKSTDFPVEKIATLASVSLDFVKTIKKGLRLK